MPNSHEFIVDVNRLLAKLDESGDLNTGIEVANQVVRLLGTHDTKEADLVVDEHVLQLPNAERYDRWFHNHPWMGGERAAFELTDARDIPIQAKFYWIQKRSRQFIAGSVHFTENWEDADYTHNDNFKVGIDFFLAPNGRSVIVALSNRGNIRVVELQHKLNNTQVDIFTKWRDAFQISSTEALHTTLWESFKLQSVNKDFYTGVANSFTELLQHLKSIGRDEEDAKLFASRLLGRLLFVWFLRKKDIIDESLGYFDASSDTATNYYKRSLERLFFNTLNTPIDDRDEFKKELQKSLFPESDNEPQAKLFQVDNKTPYLNGGLFEPHDNDWYRDSSLTFPAGFFTNLYNHFDQFNFTTDESSPEYEQVAIDPEMLGRVFESLLATQVDETGQQARKAKGAFYTPREIVSYMCRESLRNYLYGAKEDDERYKKAVDELLDRSDHEWAGAGTNSRRDAVPKEYRTVIVDALDTVTVLDPACGSGAFPMGMLQLLIKTYERLEGRFDPYKTKLQIVQNNIFGVDIEPMAVEISRLRAWLSLIVDEDDSRDVAPLPNLDFKFVCANSLIPLDESKADLFNDPELHKQLAEIRQTYFNARKPHTKKAAQQKYYKLAGSNTGLFDNLRTRQLKSFDPFINSLPAEFFNADQMFGIEKGFDVVIGNPPYVEHKKLKNISKQLREHYDVYTGSSDLSVYFFEFAYRNLKESGVLAYINTNKFFNTEYGKKLREYILNKEVLKLINFEQVPVFENVLVSSCVIISSNAQSASGTLEFKLLYKDKLWKTHFSDGNYEVYPYEFLHDTEWSFKSSSDIGLKQKIENDSKKIKDIEGVVIRRGVTTGYDPAFIINEKTAESLGTSEVIKPFLKGAHVKRYRTLHSGLNLIFTRRGYNIEADLKIKEHLRNHYEFLKPKVGDEKVGRKPGAYQWFEIQDNIAYYNDFLKPKIIWPLTADKWGFAYDESGSFLGSGSFMLTTDSMNIMFILGVLNSKLMKYYFAHTGVMTAGGAFTLKKSTIERMPLRLCSVEKQNAVGNIVSSIIETQKRDSDADTSSEEAEIDKLVYEIYNLSPDDIKLIEDQSA